MSILYYINFLHIKDVFSKLFCVPNLSIKNTPLMMV